MTLESAGGSPYLFWRQYGDVVLVDGARFLLNGVLVDFLFEVFAGQPEQHVLLAVLRPQELPENISTRRVLHQLVEGLRPQPDLFHRGFGAEGGGVGKKTVSVLIVYLFVHHFLFTCC